MIFAIEDDAQDGPDHVSDQRTTLFVVSPYSRGGVRHEHYATVSILRTYRTAARATPAFHVRCDGDADVRGVFVDADLRPYTVHPPSIDISKRNLQTAYGALQSARLDFSRPDAIAPAVLNGILAHNHD